MKLSKFLKSLEKHKIFGSRDIDVSLIVDDSRKAKRGSLFVAIPGLTVNGYKFIPDVIKKGASVVVGEKPSEKKWLGKITYIKVKNSRKALALLASAWYDHPSRKLKVIGITGTKGKTTTSEFLYQILKESDKKVGLISTVSAKISDKKYNTGLHTTNPEPLILHKLLGKMVEANCEYAIVEVTSHGIDQERIAGINFDTAILTNIAHEHLDYHKTFDDYRMAKARLFEDVRIAILNRDNESFDFMFNKVSGKSKIISYSLGDKRSDVCFKEFVPTFKGGTLKGMKLLGDYNVSNILAAIACARESKLSWKKIERAIAKIKMPTGRLEKIKNKKGIDIYIDFAHTPDSLGNVLSLLRSKTKRRLICILGCAGERDAKKRSMMGEISGKLADVSIFTAEDPRGEDVDEIIKQLVEGINKTKVTEIKFKCPSALEHQDKKHCYVCIPERGEAISFAIQKLAKRGDMVVVCGKGHEKSMAYNGVEYPWSDHKAIKFALDGKVKKIERKKR